MPEAKKKETNNLNIYQKIVEVRRSIQHLSKDAASHHHKYVSGDNLLSAIRPKMDELGIVLLTNIIQHARDGMIVDMTVEYHFINSDHPEDRFVIPWYATGRQNDPSQSFGSAMTYSERYVLKKTFLVPTDEDDPDAKSSGNDKSKQKSQQFQSHKSTPSNGNHKETIGKISAACMWLGGGNPDSAKSYFKTHAKYQRKDGTMREPQELKDLSEREAQILWGKLKDYFNNHNLDMSAALKEYGNEKGGE